MPKLIFRGTKIRFIDLRYDDKSKTPYVKVNFTSAFSDPVRQAMEWGEVPAGFASANLDGEFNATHMILTPNGGAEMKQHEMQINAKEIGGFKLVRVKGDDGDSTSNELRFQVVTADPEAAFKLRDYISKIGKGEAQLRVNYTQDGELALDGEKDPQGKLISEDQARDTAKASDDVAGPTLASAREVGGGRSGGRAKEKKLEPVN